MPNALAHKGAMPVRLIPALLALAWGFNWPAVKIMLTAIPPFTLRMLGLGGGAVLLLMLAAAQGRRIWPERAAWRGIAMAGVLNVALFNFCTAFAQLNTSTSRAAVLTFTFPMMSALMAWAFIGERPGRRGTWALLLGGVGVAVLAWPVLDASTHGAPLLGLTLPLLAAFAWATGTVVTKRWPLQGDRVVATAWQLLLGASLGVPASWLAGEQLPVVWPPTVIAALVFHIVVATALAYVMWYRLLEAQSATVASLTTLAVPVVGVLGAMALVGDRPSAIDWLGFALVLAGAALVALKMPKAV